MSTKSKNVLIVGTGLGALSTALRMSHNGFKVTMVEKDSKAGGRLNQLKEGGFTFDMGPSFISMTYEFEELFRDCKIPNPFKFEELDPLYKVFFSGKEKTYLISKDMKKLAKEFADIEPDFEAKASKYLERAARHFHDTEYAVVKRNFRNMFDYLMALTSVPKKHIIYLKKSLWKLLDETFESEEVKIIFSLIAFFLGSTPFKTPALYSLLNYTEFRHNGYWYLNGGMYKITEEIVKELEKRGVEIHYNTEITAIGESNGIVNSVKDNFGREWRADLFVVNSDAAYFRGKVLNRSKYTEKKLDKMDWSLAPLTIYLGVKGKVPVLEHHNYFLGSEFQKYAKTIFTSSEITSKPYYYVNMPSKSDAACAPEGCENLFILCPVPDLRYKKHWNDIAKIESDIIDDLSERTGFDLKKNTLVKRTMTPSDWESKFNLYRGSGLGLSHGVFQVGAFRPSNKDEEFPNLYYVGASTIPGTGLPMVLISSKLVTERILDEH